MLQTRGHRLGAVRELEPETLPQRSRELSLVPQEASGDARRCYFPQRRSTQHDQALAREPLADDCPDEGRVRRRLELAALGGEVAQRPSRQREVEPVRAAVGVIVHAPARTVARDAVAQERLGIRAGLERERVGIRRRTRRRQSRAGRGRRSARDGCLARATRAPRAPRCPRRGARRSPASRGPVRTSRSSRSTSRRGVRRRAW